MPSERPLDLGLYHQPDPVGSEVGAGPVGGTDRQGCAAGRLSGRRHRREAVGHRRAGLRRRRQRGRRQRLDRRRLPDDRRRQEPGAGRLPPGRRRHLCPAGGQDQLHPTRVDPGEHRHDLGRRHGRAAGDRHGRQPYRPHQHHPPPLLVRGAPLAVDRHRRGDGRRLSGRGRRQADAGDRLPLCDRRETDGPTGGAPDRQHARGHCGRDPAEAAPATHPARRRLHHHRVRLRPERGEMPVPEHRL
ncbi:hypothetical protein D3C86_1088140 [compost metagenome]